MTKAGYLLFDFKFYRVSRNNYFQDIGKHQPLWCEAVWLFDFIGQNKQPSLQLALKSLRICKALQYCDYGLELARFFKDSGIISDEMFNFFQIPENWKSKKKNPTSKIGKLLKLLPKKINQKLMRGLQQVLD